MIFLKLGGSLITDKTRDNTPRLDVMQRLAHELADVLSPSSTSLALPILVGHGSGSFGHAAARKHGTRSGASDAAGWRGFADVSVAAARLNRLVADALHDAGLPVFSILPSSSAGCDDGRLTCLATHPIRIAIRHGLVPLVMGDVAFDSARGATIVSTEEVFAYLAREFAADPLLRPTRILLAGETEGVYAGPPGSGAPLVERITPGNWETLRSGVGGSRGADVTGGMAAKVADMLDLARAYPGLTACIFSGLVPGNLARAIQGAALGTTVAAA